MSMGPETTKISNLISDMTIAGATEEEMERAISHSRIVMLFERSSRENGIAELLEKYQNSANAKTARLLTETGRFTIAEAAEAMSLPVDKVKSLLED